MVSKGLRILVVEDESIIMMGFKAFLKQLGHIIVAEAYDGETAVELAETFRPDLIIMDVKMPKLDGIQALEKINNKPDGIIPCIFVTAHSDEQLIVRATEAGAFNYLIKPISIDSIKAAIEIAMVRFGEYRILQEELKNTKESLTNRKYIERAKGILMDQFGVKEQQAMEMLQKRSRNTNKKLIEVAKEIIKSSGVNG